METSQMEQINAKMMLSLQKCKNYRICNTTSKISLQALFLALSLFCFFPSLVFPPHLITAAKF